MTVPATNDQKGQNRQEMILNMGPQHPSTHGVLRLILHLEGEVVQRVIPVIGYLHRGIEKLGEYNTYIKNIVFTDRLDYTSGMCNNLAYALAVEKLCGIEVPERARVIRVIMAELNRIAAHLLWLGTYAIDIGAITPFFYCFREREKILDMFEMVSGQRLTPSYICIGGVRKDITDRFREALSVFVDTFETYLKDYEGLLTKNPIWVSRLRDVAVLPREDAINWGATGPVLRASGVQFDFRKAKPYCGYENYEFDIPYGTRGDCYDRYMVRVEEMRQSLRIIRQAMKDIPDGPVRADVPYIVMPDKEAVLTDIEALIKHFKIASGLFQIPKGEVYSSVENPKGELGFYIVSDGSSRPYRMRIKSSCFVNLSALPFMVEGKHMVADVVAALGSIDIVLGEVDR
ncbi:NADH dehydrogenase subunit D [Thermodesulforhabdus norvegica]|uniref:NADH-quinone oxidoreductase subunit D n=2 Tax=Thermodesulforhabdus norvegica TaxID=39841 RepID=A0A1I4UK23_9BACT|nr:NADH dehydrogenase (quinone) subunit D [Thermodesulforhabdus norvegica]SFM89316.1 NADH dehydrogenase subunit D [Thermodesulforhabdus norvegica]